MDKCIVGRISGHNGIVSFGRVLKRFGASLLTTALLYNSGMRSTFDEVVIADLAHRALGKDVQVQSVDEGISTSVYKIVSGNDAFYLRIAPEDENYTPEVTVHGWLLQRGVPVPEVIHYENFNEQLGGRSFMMVSEIPGQALNTAGDALSSVQREEVLFSAGAALAQINSIPLEGFGWVKREGVAVDKVEGGQATYKSFVTHGLKKKVDVLVEKGLIDAAGRARIAELAQRLLPLLDYEQGYLAHGDLDTGHIYVHEGKFSGFIDFGDIRSTDPYYDLAHFQVQGGELFPFLLKGYSSVTTLTDDFSLRLAVTKFLLTIQKVGWVATNLDYKQEKLLRHPFFIAMNEELDRLETLV